MTRQLILAAAAVATLALTGAAAHAADTVTLTVKTADLDLSSVAGRQAAHERIEAYVKKACYEEVIRSRRPAANEKCRADLIAKFDSQLTSVVARAYPEVRQAEGAASTSSTIDQTPAR